MMLLSEGIYVGNPLKSTFYAKLKKCSILSLEGLEGMKGKRKIEEQLQNKA